MIRVEVEGKVVGGGPDAGAGRVFIESSAQVTLEELIRLTVQEQVRELLAHRQLSADDVEAKLASQYQTVEEIRRLRQAIGKAAFGPPRTPNIDIENVQRTAIEAFREGRYMVLVNDRQLE
ncbi:MAG: hypothetical protein E6I24_02305, partial [Chloroflexi bacterium]